MYCKFSVSITVYCNFSVYGFAASFTRVNINSNAGASYPTPWHRLQGLLSEFRTFRIIRAPAVMHSIGTFCRVCLHTALLLVSERGKLSLLQLQTRFTRFMGQYISLASLTRSTNTTPHNFFCRVSSMRYILSKGSELFQGLVPDWLIPILDVMSNTVGISYSNANYTTVNYLYMSLLTTISGIFLWNFAPQLCFGYRHLHEIFTHFADMFKKTTIPLFRMSEENGG